MKNILSILILISFSAPAFAAKSLSVAEVKSKYNIVEGNYKLISGAPDECVAGEYKVFKGTDENISLRGGGGLMARKIHKELVNTQEHGCSTNFTTMPTIGGFKNIEAFHCPKDKTSYTRTIQFKFEGGQLQYTMATNRILQDKKSKTTCLLELITAQ